MSKFLAHSGFNLPQQGSSAITELVKHFESNVSFDDLQSKINTFLLLLKTPLFPNRPSIRTITFNVFEKLENPNKGDFHYFAQIHYILIGDGINP